MKILQINSVYGIASTGRTCMELTIELEKKDHVHILTACKNASLDPEHTIQIGNKIDYKVHALLSRITGLPSYFSRIATKKLIKHIEHYAPDVVHLRNMHSNSVDVPLLLKYLGEKDIATVLTLHDCFMFTGKCTHPIRTGCMRYTEKCGKCPQLHEGNKSWFFDRTEKILKDKKTLFNQINRLAVVGVSDWATNQSIGSILDCAKIRRTIYNWINMEVFRPDVDPYPINTNLPIILGVASNWEDSKGYEEFCELAILLKGQAQILLVGSIAEGKKIPEIMYHGMERNTTTLAGLYKSADVFFNPTKMETFGKVSAEALACGTPVVAYDVTANSEIIANGCGYLVDPGNITQVFNCITKILEKGKANYSDRCVAHVRENFSLEKNSGAYYQLYNELMKMKGI